MKLTIILTIAAFLTGLAQPSSEAAVSLTEEQSLTSSGQAFEFGFDALPDSDGTGGEFVFVAKGDYSGVDFETAVIMFDTAGGILDLGGPQRTGVMRNTVPGLSLDTFIMTVFNPDDVRWRWVFNMSGALLDTILADNQIDINVQNDPNVNVQGGETPDFVRVEITYNDVAVIPVPTAFPLFLTALMALGLVARRKGYNS